MMTQIELIGSGGYGTYVQHALAGGDFDVHVYDGKTVQIEDLKGDHVIIATPNHTHYDLVAHTLNADKHVLCEKPLALEAYQVEALITTATAKDCYLGIGFVLHRHPYYQWIRENAQEWGGIREMRVYNHATEGTLQPEWYWNPALSGGWFMVSEIHWYHLFAWLTEANDLTITSAREEQKNGRTFATWSTAESIEGPKLEVEHYLNMSHDTAWCKVELFFNNGTHIVIDDWVPRSLCASDGTKKVEDRERDAIYQSLIRANVEYLVAHRLEDPAPIYLSHRAALAAQRLADKKEDARRHPKS
jgi:predicted dehydrogenase